MGKALAALGTRALFVMPGVQRAASAVSRRRCRTAGRRKEADGDAPLSACDARNCTGSQSISVRRWQRTKRQRQRQRQRKKEGGKTRPIGPRELGGFLV